ncbi:hypothetical protein DFH28DRAFT_1063874 [Melampsora americana]|nr:hypothetical protein DFH28DRAFT_1063874 [Melampsora americana]
MSSLRILSVSVVLSALTCVTIAQDLTQLIGSLSASCQAAAGGLLTSEFGTCANVMGLVPVIGASGSVVGPFGDYVTATCPAAPCSDSVVASAASALQKGCSADITKGVSTAIALATIVQNYSPIRGMLCSQYASNGTYCVLSLLGDVEKVSSKPITVSMAEGILVQGFSALLPLLATAPKEIYCNDCGHALYTQISAIKPVVAPSTPAPDSSKLVSATCGANFTDGQIPATVKQASSGSSNSSSTGGYTASGSASLGASASTAGSLAKPVSFAFISSALFAYLLLSA